MSKKHLKRLAKRIASGKAVIVAHKGKVYPFKAK